MPIKHITSNIGTIFGDTTWENRDPKMDSTRIEVINPEKSLPIDFETFEYFIQQWQDKQKFENEQYKGFFGTALIDFVDRTDTTFHILRNIVFSEYDNETISEFIYEGKIQCWPDNYFEKKYGKKESGWILQKEDYEDVITIETIKGLYEYIYGANDTNKL